MVASNAFPRSEVMDSLKWAALQPEQRARQQRERVEGMESGESLCGSEQVWSSIGRRIRRWRRRVRVFVLHGINGFLRVKVQTL